VSRESVDPCRGDGEDDGDRGDDDNAFLETLSDISLRGHRTKSSKHSNGIRLCNTRQIEVDQTHVHAQHELYQM
jgi:hypothetical protein